MTIRYSYSLILFVIIFNFLLLLHASELEKIVRMEFFILDEQLVHLPLTRENLSIHSQLSKLGEEPTSLASSLESTEGLPIKIDQPEVSLIKVDTAATSADSGTTSSESESLLESSMSFSPRRTSSVDVFSSILLSSQLIASLASFLTPTEKSNLKNLSKRIKKSIEALPAHRLACEMPYLGALFAYDSRLNDQIISFINQLDSKLLVEFKKQAKNLKTVKVIANSDREHSKNIALSFDNLQSFLWYLSSQANTLILRLRLKPLFEFFQQNSSQLAFNLANPDGPFVRFAPELFPTDPLEDMKIISEAELFAVFVELVRLGSCDDFILLSEAIDSVLGADLLVQLVYFSLTENGFSLLHLAAMNNCAELIEYLLLKMPQSYSAEIAKHMPSHNTCSLNGLLFPNLATHERRIAAVKWLRNQQLTLENETLPSRPTPLMVSIRKGNLEAAKTLYNLQNRFLTDPLAELLKRPLAQLAVLSMSSTMLTEVLYEFYPARDLLSLSLQSFSFNQMNPLQMALQIDCSEAFCRILALDRDQLFLPHPQTRRLPIHIAAQFSSPALLSLVLDETGAPSVMALDAYGNTPLVYALRVGRFDNASLLWSHLQDSFGMLRLISSGVELIVLQTFFASQERIDNFLLNSPLLMGNVSFVAALVLSRKTEALCWFLEQASPPVTERILSRTDVANNSLLHLCVLSGNIEAFQWLHSKHGIIVQNYYNSKGQTILNLIDELPSAIKHQFLSVLK